MAKKLPFKAKVTLSLVLFGIFILSVLFIYMVPKMEEQQYTHEVAQIEQMVELTKHQMKLVKKFLEISLEDERVKTQESISRFLDLVNHKLQYDKKFTLKVGKDEIQDSPNLKNCYVEYYHNKEKEILSVHKNPLFNSIKNSKEGKWIREDLNIKDNMCPHFSHRLIYQKSIGKNKAKLSCSLSTSSKLGKIERDLKQVIQKGFSVTENIHKGKIYLMWVNKDNKSTTPLFQTKNLKNVNYCLSKISKEQTVDLGNLTGEDIFKNRDKGYLKHKIKGKNALTWINTIGKESSNRSFFLVVTVYEEDLKKSSGSVMKKVLPIAIIVLALAIFSSYLIFKNFFRDINTLAETAKKVKSGKISVRSKVRGSDDIGILGSTFDSMLNRLESNIQNLDKKVAIRTEELTSSLKEKEILLKEIHHRVKNNLSMTINFIKLQKYKVEDSNTKEVLSDIENRVYTMELLHRKLYENRDLGNVDFKSYIEDLLGSIVENYKNYKDVLVQLNIDEIFMDIDYSMPCGLVINEIVTNSFKYAFNKDEGVLKVDFTKRGNKCILKINDNGVGLPKDFKIEKSSSLGLRFIHSIVTSQLNGSVCYKYCDGACFTIEFAVKP
ncbi:MAG: HAMP domain-containing protein [Campylobacterales bacterium]|nr:HAMP domain-containing protein [Campylobacterales bacterium]